MTSISVKLHNSIMIAALERWPEFDENRSWIIPFRFEGKWRTMEIRRDGESVEMGAYNVPELPGVKMSYNSDVDTLVVDCGATDLLRDWQLRVDCEILREAIEKGTPGCAGCLVHCHCSLVMGACDHVVQYKKNTIWEKLGTLSDKQ